MGSLVAVAMCLALFGVEPEKKPLTPKQQREAAEKAIKDKMAPLEKSLADQQMRLAKTKAAQVTGKPNTATVIAGMPLTTSFRRAEDKQKHIEKYTAAIEKLTAELKPLQDELKALKRPPKKPEPAKVP